MEPLWSPVVATRGNRRQIDRPPIPQKQAESVAAGCHRLPEKFHGKEGVDGSSPSEGSAKVPHVDAFSVGSTCARANVREVWSLGSSPKCRDVIQKSHIADFSRVSDAAR